MQKIIEFTPAFDKRDSDPKKNYGIHGVEMRFVLKGDLGAVQFLIYTNWHLPHVQQEFESDFEAGKRLPPYFFAPSPADLGYHSPKPMYDEHSLCQDSCLYLDGKPCYYDGSVLNARPVLDALLVDGQEGVWRNLEKYYRSTFEEVTSPSANSL